MNMAKWQGIVSVCFCRVIEWPDGFKVGGNKASVSQAWIARENPLASIGILVEKTKFLHPFVSNKLLMPKSCVGPKPLHLVFTLIHTAAVPLRVR